MLRPFQWGNFSNYSRRYSFRGKKLDCNVLKKKPKCTYFTLILYHQILHMKDANLSWHYQLLVLKNACNEHKEKLFLNLVENKAYRSLIKIQTALKVIVELYRFLRRLHIKENYTANFLKSCMNSGHLQASGQLII